MMPREGFPDLRRVLVVVAHPDDESFGLGGVLDVLTRRGAEVTVLCLTHGEASTLHGGVPGDLARVRAVELAAAADVLAVARTRLLSYPDGGLAGIAGTELADRVREVAAEVKPTHLLVFDDGGVTGHPDHVHATRAAVAAARGLPVLAWTVPEAVTRALNTEFGTAFRGRRYAEIDWTLRVDRARQWRAIAAHASQSADNPVLRRRLELLGDTEHLLALRPGPLTSEQGPGPAGRSAVAG
jgi:LmbE family N-acetylglucosaminyl deacetylase